VKTFGSFGHWLSCRQMECRVCGERWIEAKEFMLCPQCNDDAAFLESEWVEYVGSMRLWNEEIIADFDGG